MKRRRRGFTWIEVLASIFVVGITATLFGSLFPMAAKSQAMVANHQQALGLIQHKIDQMRAVGYGRLTYTELKDASIIDASPTVSPFRFDGVDGLSTIYPAATGTITITDFSTTIRQVSVTLTWTGSARRQGNGSLTLSALIAKG
jgi:prepilin-type N-terminal cleavage/methylation domain-containing protein